MAAAGPPYAVPAQNYQGNLGPYAPPHPLGAADLQEPSMAGVRQELAQLEAGLVQYTGDIEQFKLNLYHDLHAILVQAVANAGGALTITQATVDKLVEQLQDARGALALPRGDGTARGHVLQDIAAAVAAPNNSLKAYGGWTPKPRRKITKRRRKSFKSRA